MKVMMETDCVKKGMKLAERAYDLKGRLLFTAGLEINEDMLMQLRDKCEEVVVDISEFEYEQYTSRRKIIELIHRNRLNHAEKVKDSKEYQNFEKRVHIAKEELKDDMDKMLRYNKYLQTEAILEKTDFVLKELHSTKEVFDYIYAIKGKDESTYAHFLNVSMLCNVFGKWLDMPKKDIDVLTLAGTLHDVGKLVIPTEILTKKGKLTDEEFSIIKSHTIEGYKILDKQGFDARIKEVALMHHERCDGKGYPLGLNINTIPDFAKIVAIADVYEAMTAERVYRKRMCPFTVMGLMSDDGMSKYDPTYSMLFFEKMAYTYVGYKVKLTDGRSGEVSFINKNRLDKPILKLDEGFVDISQEECNITEMF